MCEIFINRKYKHFKGKEYMVLHVAKHSETQEEFVVYKALYGDYDIWIRTLEMFCSLVEKEGMVVERFTLME